MVLGMFFIGISTFYWTGRLRALRLESALLDEYQQMAEVLPDRPSRPKHIFIEWFVDSAIETQVYAENRWTISSNFSSYLDQSARPSEPGNIIIYGHNTRNILGNIRALKGGEEIKITSEDETERLYVVTEIHEVGADQTKYLEPTFEETLTLYTCSGFMDQKRFIVRAKPKS